MAVYLASVLSVILPLIIPTAILVSVAWMVISVLKQLDRLEALLSVPVETVMTPLVTCKSAVP